MCGIFGCCQCACMIWMRSNKVSRVWCNGAELAQNGVQGFGIDCLKACRQSDFDFSGTSRKVRIPGKIEDECDWSGVPIWIARSCAITQVSNPDSLHPSQSNDIEGSRKLQTCRTLRIEPIVPGEMGKTASASFMTRLISLQQRPCLLP